MTPPSGGARGWTAALALSTALLVGASCLFFGEVSSAGSDHTAGDAAHIRQVVHNAAHGRPLQMSIYFNNLGGVRRNPGAYANELALHFNVTPYLIALPYRLFPTIEGLYALVMAFNYLGIALWMAWILRSDSDRDEKIPMALCGLLLWCGFFWTVTYKNHFPLLAGPFVFAMHALRTRGGAPFWAALALSLGISEDIAMFVGCYGAYLFLFEPETRRRGAAVTAAAVAWTLMVVWLQGTLLRRGMELSQSSNIMGQLEVFLGAEFQRRLIGNLAELLRSLAALLPLLLLGLLGNAPEARGRLACKTAGFLVVAPASHWAITMMVGGGHHWMPVVICALLAHLELLRTARWSLMAPAALPLGALFFALNSFGLFYSPLKRLAKEVVLPSVLGYPTPDTASQEAHNRRVIRSLDEVPRDRGLTIWTPPPVAAFAADRPHLWIFPSYFDRVDILVIDKTLPDAAPSDPFDLTPSQEGLLDSLLEGGVLPRPRRAELVRRMVEAGTHRLVRDDADLWILERIERAPPPEPRSSLGLGFL